MKIPEDQGLDLGYLQRGAAAAKKALGNAFNERNHPITQEAIAKFADEEYALAATRYTQYYLRLMEAALWRYGQHSVQINPQTWLFETIPVDVRIPKPDLNLIGDKVESTMGDMLRDLPRGALVPADNTPMARRGALIGDAYLRVKDEEDEIDEHRTALAECMITWGDVYSEVVVDRSVARSVEVPMFVEAQGPDGAVQLPIQDDSGRPVTKTLQLADETVNILTPLQVFFNETCKNLKTSRKVHSHTFEDIDWCRSTWPKWADKMITAGTTTQAGQYQTRMTNLLLKDASRLGGMVSPGTATDQGYNEHAALVHVIRMNPDAFYPKGRYFIIAGGVCVVAGPLPFGKLMMVHYRYSPVPNSMFSYSLVKDCIEVNRWIEQMAHQTGMIRRTMGVPFILTPENTGGSFSASVLPMRYGGIYTYKRVGDRGPEVVHPRGTMDGGTVKEMEFWLNDFFERISGRRRAQEGIQPPGLYSGVQLRMLIAQGASKFIWKQNLFNKATEREYSLRLTAIAKAPASQFPRGIGYLSRAGQRLWLQFSAQDMGDNVVFKIETVPGSHSNTATKIEDMFQALKLGLLNPMDPQVQVGALRMLGLHELIAEVDPDLAKAQEENARISAGEQVVIGPFENDDTHLREHVRWINSPEFGLLDPQAQKWTIRHAHEHEERIQVRKTEAMAAGQIPGSQPSLYGAPVAPSAGLPPQLTPGNGVPGLPQTSVAAQQAPQEQAA